MQVVKQPRRLKRRRRIMNTLKLAYSVFSHFLDILDKITAGSCVVDPSVHTFLKSVDCCTWIDL